MGQKIEPDRLQPFGLEGTVEVATAVQEYSQIDLFRNRIPKRPYATDILGPMQKMPAFEAVRKRFLQPNDDFNLSWLVYDVDRPTATIDWIDRKCPPPNIIATNRETGHAHLFYGLEAPVWRQYGERDKAFRYAAAVDVALTRALEADTDYGKLLAKNPLREDAWIVQTFQRFSYDLPWLADYLDMEAYRDLRRNLPPVGLGRNCTLFEYTRRWAYKAIRREGWLGLEGFQWAVESTASGYNAAEFPQPLSFPEVRATAKSIAKWTWAHMSPEGFKAWADARRAKSLATRQGRAEALAERIRAKAHEEPGLSNRELARRLQVDEKTVRNARRTPTI